MVCCIVATCALRLELTLLIYKRNSVFTHVILNMYSKRHLKLFICVFLLSIVTVGLGIGLYATITWFSQRITEITIHQKHQNCLMQKLDVSNSSTIRTKRHHQQHWPLVKSGTKPLEVYDDDRK